MRDLDAPGASSARRRQRNRDEARHRPVVELLLDADDGRAGSGAPLQRAIGTLEAGIDDRRTQHFVAAAIEPAEQTHRAMLLVTRVIARRAARGSSPSSGMP
jgi:hypothetical protein